MNKMEELLSRYPQLKSCEDAIRQALTILREMYHAGGKLLVCGNGGSAADCEHIVGELMKGFLLPRPISPETDAALQAAFPDDAASFRSSLQRAIPAISLPSQLAVLSAYVNDVQPEYMYAQLVQGYGRKEDVLLCLSTSGNSKNVVRAAQMARILGMRSIALTGQDACRLDSLCTAVIKVDERQTFKIQELHLPVYHFLCAQLEEDLFST